MHINQQLSIIRTLDIQLWGSLQKAFVRIILLEIEINSFLHELLQVFYTDSYNLLDFYNIDKILNTIVFTIEILNRFFPKFFILLKSKKNASTTNLTLQYLQNNVVFGLTDRIVLFPFPGLSEIWMELNKFQLTEKSLL